MGRLRIELDLAGLDLREVEDVVDDRQERRPRSLTCCSRRRCSGAEIVTVEEEIGEAEDRVQRRADLVAHGGEEVRLGLARLLGLREQDLRRAPWRSQLVRLRLAV